MTARTLDVGCGRKKTAGAVGIDHSPHSDADVLCDLTHSPWPLRDNSFDEIHCHHVVEHMQDIVAFINEVHRVGKPGARVTFVTPHYSSVHSWEDPTHRFHLSLFSFDVFAEDFSYLSNSSGSFRVLSRELGFSSSPINWLPRLIARWRPRWYEKHLAFVFPGKNIHVELEIQK